MIGLRTPSPMTPSFTACYRHPVIAPLGTLERVLRKGWFAVTAELNPPDSADPRDVLEPPSR